MEDEILWSLVFNYLEEAQKRAKKEGPAANPSGGLKAEEINTALSGFLGMKQAAIFVNELFSLLKEAEESETGIPAEFGMKLEAAVKEAYGIINVKRREMDLAQRIKREVSHNDRYSKDKEPSDYIDSSRDRHDSYHNNSRRHSRSRSRERHYHERRSDYKDRSRDYNDDHRSDYHRDERTYHKDNIRTDSKDDRDRSIHDYRDTRVGRYRDRSREGGRDYRDRRRHGRSRSYSREHSRGRRADNDHNRVTKPSIPSSDSSSSSASPSPCWESSLETSLPAAPRAPVAQENVPNALEQALRAKALQALANKKQK